MTYLSTFSGIGGFEKGIQLTYESKVSIRDGKTQTTEPKTPKQSMESATEGVLSNRNKSDPELRGNAGALSCIGYSEIDKYASQIYQSHFPYEQCTFCKEKEERNRKNEPQGVREREVFFNNEGTEGLGDSTSKTQQYNINSTDRQFNNCTCKHKPYGDITTIIAENLPDFDLLVGGFPCQSFSIAGKRGGFNDTRGTMFFELARILRAKQPRLFVFENVKGLLSHDGGRTFATIIQTLDELGYDLQWQVLNSKNHGVPQNRERVFIIGHLRGTRRPEVFPFTGTDQEDTKSNKGRNTDICPTIRATHYKSGDNQPLINQLNHPTHSNDRVYGTDGLSPTLNTMQGGNRQPFIPEDGRIRRLTPTECGRLQGFPDHWCDGVSDSQKYKCAGNAVTVNVIRDIMEKLI